MVSKRRLVRIKAMEVLYAHKISRDHIDKVKKDLLSELTDLEKYNFASDLIDAVLKNQALIDGYIESKIKNWDMDRLAILDMIILRIGIAEMLYFPEIPPKASINEAIEIAKMYSTAKGPVFINGILDALLKDFYTMKLINKSGRGLLELKKKENEK
jgi:transcription antitermination protein NusB